jgi:RNA polymerase sigma-70 factor (ECF subfamily)
MMTKTSKIINLSKRNNYSNSELVELIIDGDSYAKKELYLKHADIVGSMAYKLMRNREDAEDLVQDTFIQVYKDLYQLKDAEQLKNWILKIAVRKAYKQFRKRKLYSLFISKNSESLPLQNQVVKTAPQEIVMELTLLNRGFNKMSSTEKIAWVMHNFEGYSIGEIAVFMNMSKATVKRRIKDGDLVFEKIRKINL